MRFVPVKSAEQQALLALHRVRYGFVVERTAIINRLRGLMAEFGVILPLRAVTVRRQAAHIEQQAKRSEPARRLMAIRGDAYLRNLLVQGARSVLHTARTLVATANKNARIAWALLAPIRSSLLFN